MLAARPSCALGLLVVLVAVLAAVAPARATTLEGVVRTLAVDPVDDARAGDDVRTELVVGRRTYALDGVAIARDNVRVRVTGALDDGVLRATAVHELGPVRELPATGTTRVLAILATWTEPDAVTPQSAAAQLFGDSADWYRDASYGALAQAGDVTPWLRVAPPDAGCFADRARLMGDARAAAAAAGYDVASYANVVVYFPRCDGDAATKAGWAYVGAPGVWLNGVLDRRTTVHEQGHNYGLLHAHALLCSDGGLAGTCTFEEYGDPYGAMGAASYTGHFDAAQKDALGWLAGREADLSLGGAATLAPVAGEAAGARAAVVALATGRRYWLEFRRPTAFDAGLPGDGTDGVLVHASGPGSGATDGGAVLLDVRPQDGISVRTATLRAGESWTSPDGVTVRAEDVGLLGATVAVAIAPVLPAAPLEVTAERDDAANAATVRWSPPARAAGADVRGFRVERDGTDAAGEGPTSATVGPDTSALTFGGLLAGETYVLGVRALGAAGPGPAATVTVTMAAPGVPGAPAALTLTRDDTARAATLRWAPPRGGGPVTGYRVRRNGVGASGAGPLVTTVAAGVREATLDDLAPSVSYTLTVQAANDAGAGRGRTVKVTVPAQATGDGAPG